MVDMNKRLPICETEKCIRKGKEFYVYTDGEMTIGLCYACGSFDGTGTDPDLMEEFVYQPELVLDLIKSGQLILIN